MKKMFIIILLIFIKLNGFTQQNNFRWVVAGTGLRLRTEPALTSPKIILIPAGEQIELLNTLPETINIDNISGNWIQIKWNTKTGWVFSGYISESNPCRWVSSKSGLPYRSDKSARPAVIPYGEKVIYIGPSKIKNRVSVIWKEEKVYVRDEFLSLSSDFKYDYPDIRKSATKKLEYNHDVPLYPEDLFIKKHGWLYHIIYVYRDQENDRAYNESFWIKKDKSWEEVKVYGTQTDYMEFTVLNINDDGNPDVIGSGGCCSSWSVQVYLGQPEMNFKTIFDHNGDFDSDDSPTIISVGKCNATVIKYKKRKYVFNCEKNEFY